MTSIRTSTAHLIPAFLSILSSFFQHPSQVYRIKAYRIRHPYMRGEEKRVKEEMKNRKVESHRKG